MRYFDDLTEAIREIRRDLIKSPLMSSTRVQGAHVELQAHEAMNYAFTLPNQAVPNNIPDLVDIARSAGMQWYESLDGAQVEQLVHWALTEFRQRAYNANLTMQTELRHPVLSKVAIEGRHPSYTYGERTVGMMDTLKQILSTHEDSRRAYWPIYHPVDAFRAAALTRVPCTLGYHFMTRVVTDEHGGSTTRLHATNIMRSCDFEIYWLTDVWFTAELQRLLTHLVDDGLMGNRIKPGNLTQTIVSFHMFDRGQEIF